MEFVPLFLYAFSFTDRMSRNSNGFKLHTVQPRKSGPYSNDVCQISRFLTPSPTLSHSRNLLLLSSAFGITPSPKQCGRHLIVAPKLKFCTFRMVMNGLQESGNQRLKSNPHLAFFISLKLQGAFGKWGGHNITHGWP